MASPSISVQSLVNGHYADVDSPLPSSSGDILASLDEYDGDIVGWINDLLDGPPPAEDTAVSTPAGHNVLLAEMDRRVAQLARRLEVASQDTASQLERSIDDITRTVPRLTYDLQFMRESALSLKGALESIQMRSAIGHTSSGDTGTVKALESLQYLDTVKTHMEASLEVLREAESWSTLEAEVTSLISEQQYDKASDRLAEANRSMPVFQNTPEYESRRALMVSLQNQLEASLSSALVAAINSRDTASCKTFYSIFCRIQRESEFRNYYYGSRRASLVGLWQKAALSDCAEEVVSLDSAGLDVTPPRTEAPIKLTQLLSRFFTEFLALLNEERNYIPAIFPDPQHTLSALIQSLMDALTPAMSQRLTAMSETYGAAALPELITAFRTTEEFALATEKVMEKLGNSAFFSASSATDEAVRPSLTTAQKRSSKRMSISRRMGPNRSSVSYLSGTPPGSVGGPWEQALFEPFIEFQNDYYILEKRFLENAYGTIATQKRSSDPSAGESDVAQILREQSAEVFSMAEDSLERCMALTHGYGVAGLIQALDHLFPLFLGRARENVVALRKVSTDALRTISPPQPGEEGLQDLDYTAEDWTVFQLGLHLLETSRAIKERLLVLEGRIKSGISQVAGSLRLARIDPTGNYIPGTSTGEAMILSQSPLNSAALHVLLDNVEKTHTPGTPQEFAPLLIGARFAIVEITKSCQALLQNIILSPLHGNLASYPTLSLWTASKEQRNRGAFDLSIPTFSLSPSATIARVAEGLLNLPRLFEVYADDDALAFSIETLPFVDAESLALLGKEMSVRPGEGAPSKGGTSPTAQRPPSLIEERNQTETNFPVLSAEIVSSTWLSSLALSLLSHLTSNVLPAIPSLTPAGAAQLSSDLSYLSNIVRALNVEWDDLDRWKELAEVSDEEGRERLTLLPIEQQDTALRCMARMRGWFIP